MHKSDSKKSDSSCSLLRFACEQEPLSELLLQALCSKNSKHGSRVMLAVPKDWVLGFNWKAAWLERHEGSVILSYKRSQLSKKDAWLEVSNRRYSARIDEKLLKTLLVRAPADLVAVTVEPQLGAGCEKLRLTQEAKIAGFRRLYADSVEPAALPGDWPHLLFIRNNLADLILSNPELKHNFAALVAESRAKGCELLPLRMGGTVLDLDTEAGLLTFVAAELSKRPQNQPHLYTQRQLKNGLKIGAGARVAGPILLGRDIVVADEAIVVGPAVICDNVKIGSGAVLRNTVIGGGLTISDGAVIEDRVLTAEPFSRNNRNRRSIFTSKAGACHNSCGKNRLNGFRYWPRLSYARCFKRIIDIIVALVVLVLFAPVLPIIALAIKVSSPGPVFFKDRRQGLHGRFFNCLKFRTMLVGADKIQDRLRAMNIVDGPQFKMNDDPRTSAVGQFLRETYIDEIPQFINVLLGQMSVVGPRPSPASENTLCPSWRDARLSVRPGITGLWQVCRTREQGKDFQEWIYYDTRYIRELSPRLDLWICWRTILKMARNFIKQF